MKEWLLQLLGQLCLTIIKVITEHALKKCGGAAVALRAIALRAWAARFDIAFMAMSCGLMIFAAAAIMAPFYLLISLLAGWGWGVGQLVAVVFLGLVFVGFIVIASACDSPCSADCTERFNGVDQSGELMFNAVSGWDTLSASAPSRHRRIQPCSDVFDYRGQLLPQYAGNGCVEIDPRRDCFRPVPC